MASTHNNSLHSAAGGTPWPGSLGPNHRELLGGLVEQVPDPVFASISGAHLYGFESPDSDVDLRGAFVLPLESRLGVSEPVETVSLMSLESGVELDWVAHDIAKSVRLMARGSGEVLEQVMSPLIFATSPWHAELRQLVTETCVTRALHRHYSGFLHSRRELLRGEKPTVKLLLYAYRAGLTGIHALRSGDIIAHLPTLLELMPQPGVKELIERKRAGAEKGQLEVGEAAAHVAALERLDDALLRAEEVSRLPAELVPDSAPYRSLNDFLIRIRTSPARRTTS